MNIETAQNKRPTFPVFRGQPNVVQHCWVRLHRTPNNVRRTHACCDNVSMGISVKTHIDGCGAARATCLLAKFFRTRETCVARVFEKTHVKVS